MQAAIYIRVSTEEQTEGYSLSAQERACRTYAKNHQWSVVKVFADEGLSGRREDRPALQSLLSEVDAGKVHAVIVHKLDRLARNLRFTLQIIEGFGRRGIAFVSVTENIDLTTPFGWAAFQIQGVFAELYSRNLSFETAKGLTEKAQSGRWVGPVPLGYTRDENGSLIPSEDAEAVRQIFQMYVTGHYSYTDIADRLNAQGWRAREWRTGKRHLFGRESVRWILKNRAYIGFVSSGGKEYTGKHEALITQELWRATHAIREGRTVKGGKVVTQRGGGVLSGILFCFRCGKPMWYHSSGSTMYYRCAGRDHRTCDAPMTRVDRIEEGVLDVFRMLRLPRDWQQEVVRRAQALLQDQGNAPQIDRAAVEEQLRRLGLVYADGLIGADEYQRRRNALRAQLLAVPETPAQPNLEEAAKLLSSMAALMGAATLVERRQLVRQIFSHLYAEKTELKAITPTGLYMPLVGVISGWFGVADGTRTHNNLNHNQALCH